ncbi:MAG: hypothetical protein R3F14_42565 [Polyangiaceae bacterium]
MKAERWYAEQFYLLDSLAAARPDGGTLLDSTLVVWVQGAGRRPPTTARTSPGLAGGKPSTGRYVDFGGAPHQKLLVSIRRAMGLTPNPRRRKRTGPSRRTHRVTPSPRLPPMDSTPTIPDEKHPAKARARSSLLTAAALVAAC